MRNLFFSVAILSSSIAYSWNLPSDNLREKCIAPAPEWMQQQIDRDLEAFAKTGFDNTMIASTLDAIYHARRGDIAEMVHLHIQEGAIEWTTPFSLSEQALERLNILIVALKTLHEVAPLPNVDFLLSLANRYDRPYFFFYTKSPVFTISKERGFTRSVLFPRGLFEPEREEVFTHVQEASKAIAWEDREKIALWRGSFSSEYHFVHWDVVPRPRMVLYSLEHPSDVDAFFLDNHYMEAFPTTWKDWLKRENCFKPFLAPEEQLHYRYLIAVDGGAAPSSLTWQLFSGSTVLKADSRIIEWYYDQLKPFVHYFPIDNTSLDLQEKIEWLRSNDTAARSIAEHAREFAKENLSDESIFLYMYKLLDAYSKIYRKG